MRTHYMILGLEMYVPCTLPIPNCMLHTAASRPNLTLLWSRRTGVHRTILLSPVVPRSPISNSKKYVHKVPACPPSRAANSDPDGGSSSGEKVFWCRQKFKTSCFVNQQIVSLFYPPTHPSAFHNPCQSPPGLPALPR